MRILLIAFLTAIAIPMLSASSVAQVITLVEKGEAKAKIYVSGPLDEELPKGRWGSRPPQTDAQINAWVVKELNDHIEKMSGVRLDVVIDAKPADIAKPAIVLGEPAVALGAKATETSRTKEGYRLLTKDGRLLIGGESAAGVMYGSYRLLRELGCDWVMPGEIGQIVPQKKTITLNQTDIASAPDFLGRRLWYRGYPGRQIEEFERFWVWQRRHGSGEGRDMLPEIEVGGHMWDRFIKRHQEAFDADPTMLALRRNPDGQLVRRGPQLETTHPRVIEMVAQEILDTYEKKIKAGEWTKDTVAGFGVGPADGLGYSLSAEAASAGAGRVDPIVGEADRTDELVLFMNRILEIVHKKYPNAYVGCYSYSTHADFPMRHKPDPNIAQIFAPINFSRFHSVLDDVSKSQSYYRDVVKQWGRLSREQGNPLTYRGYNWNLAENMLPFSKVKIWGDELPFYKEQGFLGLNVEATKSWSVLGASDYVFMRLAWDASQDWKKLLRDYCEAAYGKGADAMEEYHLKLIETQRSSGLEAGSYHSFNVMYDEAWVKEAESLIKKATKAADTKDDKTRIGHVAHNVEALGLYLAYHEATRNFEFDVAKAGYDAMMTHWQKGYDQNSDLVAGEVPQYLKRFVLRFVDNAVKYSSGPYEIVYQIPDELKTMFDPNEVGHRMNYHTPEIVDDHFIKTRTFSTTWDAQGLTGIRDGAVWYRVPFTLPKSAKGKPVGLFIGGVEDEARVWINGNLIGSGRGFSLPFLYDLTEGVNYDGENLLAIQVVRNSKANEIGVGGIIRPSFVFTGPQLESKAPKQVQLRRVLPGGELGEVE